MSTAKPQSVTLVFDQCEIVRRGRDVIFFTLSKEDRFGRPLEGLQELHDGFDEYNNRCMVMETVSGNGPKLARLLGWMHRIDIIDPGDVENPIKYIDSWDDECKIINRRP